MVTRYVVFSLMLALLISGCQGLEGVVGDDTVRPRVLRSEPENNATGISPNVLVKITFSEGMDQARTQAAFSISPSANGSFSWDGITMIFTPQRGLGVGVTYQVTIVRTAEDSAGNDLEEDYTFVFSVGQGGAPTVVNTSPEHNAEGVAGDANIVVTFNRTMDKNRTQGAFSMDPALNGVFRWMETSASDDTMIFDPNENLAAGTTYAVVVGEEAADYYGNPLGVKYSFNFTMGGDTTPPRVVVSSQDPVSPFPQPTSTVLDRSINIVITFSEGMDTPTVEGAFSLNPATNGVFSWNSTSNTVLTFNPNSDLANATTYTATIGTGAKDLAGNSLKDSYVFSFTVGEDKTPPSAQVATPNATTGVSKATDVVVLFSEPMNRGLTQAALTITPSVNGAYIWSDGDKLLAFNPNKDLDYDTTYTLVIDTSASDLAGNLLAEKYVFSFTVESRPIPPVASVVSPASSVGVDKRTNIVVGFTKSMNRGLTQSAVSFSPPLNGSFSWDAGSKTLTFDPNIDLQNGTTYTLTIDTSAVDADSVGLAQPYVLGFTVGEDKIPPTVQVATPNSTTGVSKTTNIVVLFSEPMNKGLTQVALTITPLVNGAYTWSDGDKTLTFNPNKDLDYDTTYTLVIDTSAVDLAGNGLAEKYVFSFTVESRPVPPSVSTVTPSSVVGVDKTTNVVVSFTKGMNRGLTQGAVSFSPPVNGSFSWDAESKTLTFDPNPDLQNGTTYTLTIDTSAVDGSGVGLAQPYVLSFTVGTDLTPPAVASTSPASNQSGVSKNATVSVTFYDTSTMDQGASQSAFAMSPSTNGSFSWASPTATDHILTFTPAVPLIAGATYQVAVGTGARDGAGNSLAKSHVFYFTVGGDATPPKVTGTIPPLNATDVDKGTAVSISFDEAMDKVSTQSAFSISPAVAGSFTWGSTNNLTFTPLKELPVGVYKVTVGTGAQDGAGNRMASDYVFSFTVGNDFTPPRVLSVSITKADNMSVAISDGSTGVPIDIKSITVAFDDEMDKVPTQEAFSITPAVDGTFSWGTTSALTFNISPTNLLEEGKFYTVAVSTGARDDAKNAMENSFVIHFTTLDNTPPIVTSTDPANGSTGIKSPRKIISVTFSEDMKKGATAAFSINGLAANGTFVWSGMDKLYYDHIAPLASGSYTVNIGPAAQDLAGNGLPSTHSFTFAVVD